MRNLRILSRNDTDNIVIHFGKLFYNIIIDYLNIASQRWKLSYFQLVPSYSRNAVFFCRSAIYGNCVLKIERPNLKQSYALTEYRFLREYDNKIFCKVFDMDEDRKIILEELVFPGSTLWSVQSRNTRIDVFCSLYKDLHKSYPITGAAIFPTYNEWLNDRIAFMKLKNINSKLLGKLIAARDIYSSVSAIYSRRRLLHGDIHNDNILIDQSGKYKIIDPKGVIGDPVMDISRFILEEFRDTFAWNDCEEILHIIKILSKRLDYPDYILIQCLYVEVAIWACWNLQDGETLQDVEYLSNNLTVLEAIAVDRGYTVH